MRIFLCFLFGWSFSAFAQNTADDAKMVAINNAIFAGNLEKAKNLTQELSSADSPYQKQRAYLFLAEIAFYQGDLKGVNSYLPRIGDDFPEVSYYKNILYGNYLMVNNQMALGFQSLETALQLGESIDDKRIQIKNVLTELLLFYFEKNWEKRHQNKLGYNENRLLTKLKKMTSSMELYEKCQLYELESHFVSEVDSTKIKELGKKSCDFGLKNQFYSSLISGNLLLAKVEKNDDVKMFYLKKALEQTKKSKLVLPNSEVYLSFMDYYVGKNNLDQAIFWAQQAIYPQFLDQRAAYDPYRYLAEFYEQKGMYDSAYYYKKIGSEKLQALTQNQSVTIRDYLIGGLEKNIQEKNRLLARNKILIICISFIAGVLLLLLYFVLRLDKRLKKAMETVQKSNTEMEVFSRILSHDLKAPIFTISKLVGYVLEDEKNLAFQSQSYLVAAKDTCENSDVLINNIMTFLRHKEKTVVFEEVSFEKILNAVKSNLKEQLRINNATIVEMDLPPFLHVNRTLFVQLLQNLIQNSIKYRQLDVDPIITIRYAPVGKGYQLSLEDNGKGMPEGKSETLMRAFEQDLSSSINEGVGLGLAICSAIVKMHQGTMTISNNVGDGIKVDLRFGGMKG